MSAKFWIILLLALVFGWGLYADYSLEIARFFAGKSIEGVGTAGSWGDTFGAFNGLVSLAGALFVVRTLVLQQAALAEQQRALALQAEDAHRQRFEATFFELLKLMRELRGELVFKHSKQLISAAQNPKTKQHRLETKVGIDALTGFTLEHLFHIRQAVTNPPTASRDEIVAAYEKTMTMNTERTFAPYYRLVYSILNKVRHDSILRDQEKASYTRLLRSQLTNSELVSLAYNALSPRSADLESLLTDYHMLKYLPKSGARIRFEGIFDKQAFAARD